MANLTARVFGGQICATGIRGTMFKVSSLVLGMTEMVGINFPFPPLRDDLSTFTQFSADHSGLGTASLCIGTHHGL
jgi:hypothetical protein